MSRSGISRVTVQRTWYSAMVGMSPRGRRSMSMSNVWPTSVSGLASGAAWSMPEPSMSTWRAGSETTRKIVCAGAPIRRLASTRSDGTWELMNEDLRQVGLSSRRGAPLAERPSRPPPPGLFAHPPNGQAVPKSTATSKSGAGGDSRAEPAGCRYRDQVMESTQVATSGGWLRPVLRITGAGLLAATAAIHLDLYLTGYRNIPTIGWLFLLQVIAGFALAAAVLATGNQVVAALGAGFAVATLGGYLLSIWVGLFGFTEVRTTAGIVAGIIEVASFAVLAVLAIVALVLLIVAVAGAGATSSTPSGGTVVLKTGKVGSVTVLTNATGSTVYTFAADSPGKSNCYGDCASYWPPVTGSPSAPGIPGTFGTTTRTDGTKQVTWNGHPLYTYVGDSSSGQANGNNLNLNGGVWHEIVVSG